MPIYEFHCEACDKDFEYLVMGNDKPVCPTCNQKNIRRLLSACGFVSKGSAGETVRTASSASSCGSCAASSCASCGH